jgi:hypothetical protein
MKDVTLSLGFCESEKFELFRKYLDKETDLNIINADWNLFIVLTDHHEASLEHYDIKPVFIPEPLPPHAFPTLGKIEYGRSLLLPGPAHALWPFPNRGHLLFLPFAVHQSRYHYPQQKDSNYPWSGELSLLLLWHLRVSLHW